MNEEDLLMDKKSANFFKENENEMKNLKSTLNSNTKSAFTETIFKRDKSEKKEISGLGVRKNIKNSVNKKSPRNQIQHLSFSNSVNKGDIKVKTPRSTKSSFNPNNSFKHSFGNVNNSNTNLKTSSNKNLNNVNKNNNNNNIKNKFKEDAIYNKSTNKPKIDINTLNNTNQKKQKENSVKSPTNNTNNKNLNDEYDKLSFIDNTNFNFSPNKNTRLSMSSFRDSQDFDFEKRLSNSIINHNEELEKEKKKLLSTQKPKKGVDSIVNKITSQLKKNHKNLSKSFSENFFNKNKNLKTAESQNNQNETSRKVSNFTKSAENFKTSFTKHKRNYSVQEKNTNLTTNNMNTSTSQNLNSQNLERKIFKSSRGKNYYMKTEQEEQSEIKNKIFNENELQEVPIANVMLNIKEEDNSLISKFKQDLVFPANFEKKFKKIFLENKKMKNSSKIEVRATPNFYRTLPNNFGENKFEDFETERKNKEENSGNNFYNLNTFSNSNNFNTNNSLNLNDIKEKVKKFKEIRANKNKQNKILLSPKNFEFDENKKMSSSFSNYLSPIRKNNRNIDYLTMSLNERNYYNDNNDEINRGSFLRRKYFDESNKIDVINKKFESLKKENGKNKNLREIKKSFEEIVRINSIESSKNFNSFYNNNEVLSSPRELNDNFTFSKNPKIYLINQNIKNLRGDLAENKKSEIQMKFNSEKKINLNSNSLTSNNNNNLFQSNKSLNNNNNNNNQNYIYDLNAANANSLNSFSFYQTPRNNNNTESKNKFNNINNNSPKENILNISNPNFSNNLKISNCENLYYDNTSNEFLDFNNKPKNTNEFSENLIEPFQNNIIKKLQIKKMNNSTRGFENNTIQNTQNNESNNSLRNSHRIKNANTSNFTNTFQQEKENRLNTDINTSKSLGWSKKFVPEIIKKNFGATFGKENSSNLNNENNSNVNNDKENEAIGFKAYEDDRKKGEDFFSEDENIFSSKKSQIDSMVKSQISNEPRNNNIYNINNFNSPKYNFTENESKDNSLNVNHKLQKLIQENRRSLLENINDPGFLNDLAHTNSDAVSNHIYNKESTMFNRNSQVKKNSKIILQNLELLKKSEFPTRNKDYVKNKSESSFFGFNSTIKDRVKENINEKSFEILHKKNANFTKEKNKEELNKRYLEKLSFLIEDNKHIYSEEEYLNVLNNLKHNEFDAVKKFMVNKNKCLEKEIILSDEKINEFKDKFFGDFEFSPKENIDKMYKNLQSKLEVNKKENFENFDFYSERFLKSPLRKEKDKEINEDKINNNLEKLKGLLNIQNKYDRVVKNDGNKLNLKRYDLKSVAKGKFNDFRNNNKYESVVTNTNANSNRFLETDGYGNNTERIGNYVRPKNEFKCGEKKYNFLI